MDNIEAIKAQAIISKVSGDAVVVRDICHLETESSIKVLLEGGGIWMISPGPLWHLTVTCPTGQEELIEFRDSDVASDLD